MEKTDRSVDVFLEGLDGPRAETMRALDEVIRAAMPGRSRTLWEGVFWGGTEQEIIGYGDLLQERPRGPDVEWFVVGLAEQKRHVSMYVNAAGEDGYLLRSYEDKLGKVKTGSANITITSLDDVDLDGLANLCRAAGEACPPAAGE